MTALQFEDSQRGLCLIPLNVDLLEADGVAAAFYPDWDMDILAIALRYETLGNADNTGNIDVKDDGSTLLNAKHAITDAKKAARQDIALASPDNGKISVAAGSAITIEVDTLAGTAQAVNRLTVWIHARLRG